MLVELIDCAASHSSFGNSLCRSMLKIKRVEIAKAVFKTVLCESINII